MRLLGTIVSRLVGKLDRERIVGKGAGIVLGASPADADFAGGRSPTPSLGRGAPSFIGPAHGAGGVTNTSSAGEGRRDAPPICELEKAPAEAGAELREETSEVGRIDTALRAEDAARILGATAPRSSDRDSARARPPENGICRRQVTRQPS